jgi:hypothetical protein
VKKIDFKDIEPFLSGKAKQSLVEIDKCRGVIATSSGKVDQYLGIITVERVKHADPLTTGVVYEARPVKRSKDSESVVVLVPRSQLAALVEAFPDVKVIDPQNDGVVEQQSSAPPSSQRPQPIEIPIDPLEGWGTVTTMIYPIGKMNLGLPEEI